MTIKHDNCKNCHSLCIHAGKDREFVCINGVSCKITMEKPQTNADRIRAMSDEELIGFLVQFQEETINRFARFEFPNYSATADWLQQPQKGE